YLVVLEDLVDARLLHVEDLSADRQDRLGTRVAALLGRTARGVTLHNEQLALAGVGALAVGERTGHGAGLQQRLAAGQLARLGGGHPGPGGRGRLADDDLRLAGVTLQ